MDWYSYWIKKYVLVQIICMYGSLYAYLYFGVSCIWWHPFIFIFII